MPAIKSPTQFTPPLLTIVNRNISTLRRGNPWFDDGNIVLLSDSDDLAFKAFKGLLTYNSVVFSDFLKTLSDEEKDGCPVVQVLDSPQDLGNFLKAMHIEYERGFQLRSEKEFASLAGILRLATKYRVELLRNAVLLAFQKIYPSALANWDQVIAGTSFIWYFNATPVVNLAREVSAFSILPAAMTYLANSTSAGEAFGVPVHEGTVLHSPLHELNSEDIMGFALMKEYNHASIVKMLKFIRNAGEHCQQPLEPNGRQKGTAPVGSRSLSSSAMLCANTFKNTALTLSQQLVTENPPGYPNFTIAVQRTMEQKMPICRACRRSFDVGFVKERTKWWNGLPAVLGFTGWGDARLHLDDDWE